jgi:hypothetical protein
LGAVECRAALALDGDQIELARTEMLDGAEGIGIG